MSTAKDISSLQFGATTVIPTYEPTIGNLVVKLDSPDIQSVSLPLDTQIGQTTRNTAAIKTMFTSVGKKLITVSYPGNYNWEASTATAIIDIKP